MDGLERKDSRLVRDRVVQQALLDILQPIFDPDFHPSSYGYRPKRSCQQAVAKASRVDTTTITRQATRTMEEPQTSDPPFTAGRVPGRPPENAHVGVAYVSEFVRQYGHIQWLSGILRTLRHRVRPNRRPSSDLLTTVKQEPYTDPYVRFGERAGSRVAPEAHPTRLCAMPVAGFASQPKHGDVVRDRKDRKVS